MNATSLIESLAARGISLSPNGESVRVMPASALSPDDRQAIRDHKEEILLILRSGSADQPRTGSAARPMIVRGVQMPSTACLWTTCDGSMTAHGSNRYLCGGCRTWFELRPPEELVYVGDLADEIDLDVETEWVN